MGVDRCRMIVVAPSGPSCYGNSCQVIVASDQASFRNIIRYCARCWSNLCSSEAPSIYTSLLLHLWPSAYYIRPPFSRTLCWSLVCLFPLFCCTLCTNCWRSHRPDTHVHPVTYSWRNPLDVHSGKTSVWLHSEARFDWSSWGVSTLGICIGMRLYEARHR